MMSFSDFSWHKMRRPTSRQIDIDAYWSVPTHKLLATLGTAAQGLTLRKARLRLKLHGPNLLEAKKKNKTTVDLVVSQFKNPLVLILIIASIMSLVAAEWIDAGVVLAIVFGSTILSFAQEYIASNAIEKLRSQITIESTVLRSGEPDVVPSSEIVQGDVVLLAAGSMIPADGVILESKDFFVNQAVLTGETFPVEKNLARYKKMPD